MKNKVNMRLILTPLLFGTGGLPKEIFGNDGDEYKVRSPRLPWLRGPYGDPVCSYNVYIVQEQLVV